ncbi:MAG TPA: hypothetical protein VFP54_07495 [Acidimicrobiales bacterium]|nr:hypothetical protein [Acidimicrobiales bacterium]
MLAQDGVTAELAAFADRLQKEFAGVVDESQIADTVRRAAAKYSGARIRTYVGVLIERDARAELSRLAAG